MNLRNVVRRSLVGAAFASPLALAASARASSPIEYPDNGSETFSRGGAGLASANQPNAGHYNPAALALQLSGGTLEANYAFNKVCFDRRNPGGAYTGPGQGSADAATIVYRPACNTQANYPRFLPNLAFVYRPSAKVGIGLSFTYPSSYSQATGQWPALTKGYNTKTGENLPVAAPYRFMTMGNGTTIAFPTLSIGYAVTPEVRVGVGFVWGMAIIDSTSVGSQGSHDADKGDSAISDGRNDFYAKDLFMPGVVASVDWSASNNIDVAAWYRYVDAVRAHQTELTLYSQYYNASGTGYNPNAHVQTFTAAQLNGSTFTYRIPMEARASIRYHRPRAKSEAEMAEAVVRNKPVRDPLADDVWDVELEGSWSGNSGAAMQEVRYPATADGQGLLPVQPAGRVAPNSDYDQHWMDSFGVRLGGQYNVAPRKFAVMAGAWIETPAQKAADLDVTAVAALRGGFGGGLVFRQDRFDLIVGYQRHWNAGLDNHGDGNLHGGSGSTGDTGFRLNGPRGPLEFRTTQAVNGGSETQSANVFTLGGTLRFE